jgi:hypothetical protein
LVAFLAGAGDFLAVAMVLQYFELWMSMLRRLPQRRDCR